MRDILARSSRNAGGPDGRPLRIEGSVRSNLLAAIASARRWRGKQLHQDTIVYWGRLVEHARRAESHGEAVGDLLGELEAELASLKRPRPQANASHPASPDPSTTAGMLSFDRQR